jgi:hypothetical protein
VWNYCYGCGGDDVAERAYRKRRRVSENQEIEDRLESLILRVGEKVQKLNVILLFLLNLQKSTFVGGEARGFASSTMALACRCSILICHYS